MWSPLLINAGTVITMIKATNAKPDTMTRAANMKGEQIIPMIDARIIMGIQISSPTRSKDPKYSNTLNGSKKSQKLSSELEDDP